MKTLLILVCLAFSTCVFAQLDYSTETLVRSFPIGGYVKATIGQGFKIWQKENSQMPNSPLYGHIRPNAYFRTSGILNAAGGGIEFYPISFFALGASKEYVVRYTHKLDTFDCHTVHCDGRISKNIFNIKLGLAYKKVFLMQEFKFLHINMKNRNGAFAEELSTLIAPTSNEKLYNSTFIAGYKSSSKYSIGILRVDNRMQKTHINSSMTLPFLRVTKQKWNAIMSTGIFHTRDDKDVWTVLALLQWKGQKGLLLF